MGGVGGLANSSQLSSGGVQAASYGASQTFGFGNIGATSLANSRSEFNTGMSNVGASGISAGGNNSQTGGFGQPYGPSTYGRPSAAFGMSSSQSSGLSANLRGSLEGSRASGS